MRYSLLLLLVLFGCHPTHKQRTQPVECFSYEEPNCSACVEGKDAPSCLSLMRGYQAGEPLRSLTRASFFWKRAQPILEDECKNKDARSCVTLGDALWGNTAVERDTIAAAALYTSAASLYQSMCQQRDAAACAELGSLYMRDGYSKPREALAAYEQALDLGEGAALELLRALWLRYYKTDALFTMTTELTQSPALEKSCRAGALEHCISVGLFYQKIDPQRAKELIAFACDKQSFRGQAPACEALAQKKEGLTERPAPSAEELDIYEEDCKHGDGARCMQWLSSSKKDKSVRAVKPKVRALLEESCREGIAQDCFHLADLLIPKEVENARLAMERSCQLGFLSACQQLSSIIWWGENTIENANKARYYECLAVQLHPFQKQPERCQAPN